MKKRNVFTVENAKVANVSYHLFATGNSGYINDGEGIVHVYVHRVSVNLKTREVTYLLVGKDGREYTKDGSLKMYESVRGYECSEPKKPAEINTKLLIRRTDMSRLNGCEWVTVSDKNDSEPAYGYIAVWTFKDGDAVRTPIVVESVSKEYGKDFDWKVVDGHVPDKFWNSREEAFSFNSYKVTDSDGDTFTEDGYNKRLALTEDQLLAVKLLEASFIKARDAGVRLLWDRENCGNIFAYNNNECDSIIYGDDERCEYGDVIPVDRVHLVDTSICFCDYCGCDDYFFAMLPTARQTKEWKKDHPKKD